MAALARGGALFVPGHVGDDGGVRVLGQLDSDDAVSVGDALNAVHRRTAADGFSGAALDLLQQPAAG